MFGLQTLSSWLRTAALDITPFVATLALAGASAAQASGQLSTQPPTTAPMTLVRAMSEFGRIFEAPVVPSGTTPSATVYCASYSRKYMEAANIANAAAYEARRASQVDATALPGAGGAVYLAFAEMARGFTAVSQDFSDGDIDRPSNFAICASSFQQLAMVLPLLHTNLAGASTQLQNVATVFTTAANSGPTTSALSEWIITLGLELLKKIIDLPRELDPEALMFPTPFPMECPSGWILDCTVYRTVSYRITHISPWEYVGGLTPCLWVRAYAVEECVFEKCVCYCYPSEIHRILGLGGVRHSITLRNLGCSVVSIKNEWEWECGGAPPTTPPSAPDTRKEVENRRGCR